MNAKQFFLFYLLIVTQTSCLKKIVLNEYGVFDNTCVSKKIGNGKKILHFVPMHHIGTKNFYQNVTGKLDSLYREGFTAYFEGIVDSSKKDSLRRDTIFRKIRKITNIDVSAAKKNSGYIDTVNNTLIGIKTNLISKYNLINQPPNLITPSDSKNQKRVDASYEDLINATEKNFGTIILSEADFTIPLGKKYHSKTDKKIKNYFIIVYRNEVIAKKILSDTANRIILLYGKAHYKGILENLQKADSMYQEIK